MLTAGEATIRRTSSSRTIHDVEEGSASEVFSGLRDRWRDRPSSEMKSRDRDFGLDQVGFFGRQYCGRDKPR